MKHLLIFIFLSITLISCDGGYLTRNNPNATTDKNWWQTQQQLTNALNEIYSKLATNYNDYYGSGMNNINALSGLTDDGVWNNNFYTSINTIARGDYSAATTNKGGYNPFLIWKANYKEIRLASRFIKHAGKAFVQEGIKKRYIAEARALRAWYTLKNFLYWRHIPIVTSAITIDQAPKMTNDTSTEKVVNFIASQLDSAAVNLPYSYPTDNAWRITKGACYAMKAIVYLNAHRYEEAAQSAKRVIDLINDSGQKVYNLHHSSDPNINSYADLFRYSGEINKERILFTKDGAKDTWFRNAPTGISPGPQQGGFSPTASLVNTYETKHGETLAQMSPDSAKIYRAHPNYHNNRDPRLEATILYPGEVFGGDILRPFSNDSNNPDRIGVSTGSATGFWKRKYLDLQDRGQSGSLDFAIIRYAQILLIRIEALVESGNWQNPDVIKYLDKIRERAGMPDVNTSIYNTQEKMRDLYRRERHVELAFEGWRWFDIRRWGIAKKVMNGQVYGAVNPKTGKQVEVVTRRYDSPRDNLWPIPIHDVNSSRIKQNPGY